MDVVVDESLEYRYVIDGFTPETLPMARLAEYVSQWAKLLGEASNVNFHRVQRGSAVLVALVHKSAAPKVEGRVRGLRDGTAPPDVRESFKRLNNLLVEDNSSGRMEAGAEIFPFPGIKRIMPTTYGPFNQDGTLDGRLVRIGGRTEVKAWIDDGKVTRPCTVTKELAKKMAAHLFDIVRVAGRGRWCRDGEGEWKMLSFKVVSFEHLEEKPLSEILAKLRAIEGNGWREIKAPYENCSACGMGMIDGGF